MDILDMFPESQQQQRVNDRLAVKFVAERYGMRTDVVDKDFLGELLGLY